MMPRSELSRALSDGWPAAVSSPMVTRNAPACGGASTVTVSSTVRRSGMSAPTAFMNRPSSRGCGALKATAGTPSTKISRTWPDSPSICSNSPGAPLPSREMDAAVISRSGALALMPSELAGRGTMAAYWAIACAWLVGVAGPAGMVANRRPCSGTQISLQTSASRSADRLTAAPLAKPDRVIGRMTAFS